MKHVPISGEVEVEAEFTKERGVGAGGQETLLKIDEVALLAGAPLGKEGRVSAYGVLDFAQGHVNVGQAYGQVNDLIGAKSTWITQCQSRPVRYCPPVSLTLATCD